MSMKTKLKRIVETIVASAAVAQWFVFLPTTAIADSGKPVPESDHRNVLSSSADMSKILWVLENKIEDRQLLERTEEKLLTLDRRQVRLIASLSDRAANKDDTTGSDIAFLLMTALIALN
jgi:hypothetical protein